ncbi:MAG: ORF6N domain-containing protein [Bacilli bacterium]|nr:ORF6N domain-containing protein [Bacilli bacterium]
MDIVTNIKIENLIYEIRGKQVMLDSDLAKLYQCKNGTKSINQAVKNNMNKFPERFAFRITELEYNNLKSKILTSKGGSRKGHTVFTEQGVYMLATILKSSISTQVSIAIMDAFVAMRHYIGNNEYRLLNIESKIVEHDSSIKLLKESFDNFYKKRNINNLYLDHQIYDAYSKIKDIFSLAKKELIIIDNYADKTVLDMIKELSVKVVLITKDNNKLTELDIEKYNKEYHNLTVIRDNSFHDRYFIIDKKEVYHSGTSINYAGTKVFSINLLEDTLVIDDLIKYVNKKH